MGRRVYGRMGASRADERVFELVSGKVSWSVVLLYDKERFVQPVGHQEQDLRLLASQWVRCQAVRES